MYLPSTMWASWDEHDFGWEQAAVLLGFSATVLVPIAVGFDFALVGFLASVCIYHCGYCSMAAWTVDRIIRNRRW